MKFDGTDFSHEEWQKLKHGGAKAFLLRSFFQLSELQHQRVFDQLSQLILTNKSVPEAFLVVGGYGRGQANKLSDIDLIGISRGKIGDDEKAKLLIKQHIHKPVSLLEWLSLEHSQVTIRELLSRKNIFSEPGFKLIDPYNILGSQHTP